MSCDTDGYQTYVYIDYGGRENSSIHVALKMNCVLSALEHTCRAIVRICFGGSSPLLPFITGVRGLYPGKKF
jgi:hypothetical protein